MRIVVGILSLPALLLYVGQVISVINFPHAQKFGLQESPENCDPVFPMLELWTARWDLCWIWTLPVAGILMLIDHAFWPCAAMIGGGALVDTGGREAAKVLGLRQQGIRTGSPAEYRLIFATYAYFITVGLLAIVAGALDLI